MKPSSPTTRSDYAQRILRVLVHIQQNLDESLALDELAGVAHFSPFHFHRIFTGMVGESVKQHIRRLRLERAAMRLCHTDQKILTIALDAGFEAHESFTRAFQAAFDMPPSEFRKIGRERVRLRAPSEVHYLTGDDVDVAPFHPITIEDHPMQVEIKRIGPMRIAFVRHVGRYDQVAATWERLCDWAGAEGLFGPDTRLFGACYDDPNITEPEKIRYDACITVDEAVAAMDDVGLQTLGGGQYAVVTHEGPYHTLGDTYDALFGRWFASTRYEPSDPPCLEFYLNEPDCTPPEELLTELCVPIA